jgi:hypothetical protein
MIFRRRFCKSAVDKLWLQYVAPSKPANERNPMALTETQKVAEIQAAYDALKAAAVTANTQIAAQAQQIASLQQQVANGTPATADQIAALAAVDTLDTEVEADAAPAPTPAPTPAPAS